MELGAFSISLAVKDIKASQAFYEQLGFQAVMGPVASLRLHIARLLWRIAVLHRSQNTQISSWRCSSMETTNPLED